jgi:starvation-inducible DNA-binding protein
MPSPLTPSNRVASAKVLSELLPALRALGLTAQDAHWRVRGPMFGSLHALFGDLYSFVGGIYADAVAERIAQFFEPAPRSVLPTGGDLPTDGGKLCAELSRAILATGSKVYATMEQLEQVDPVFLAKLQDLQAQLEKYAWQIEAHIS